jgi:LysR family hydrogen peroxide-inducible transcriptional activator
MRVAASGVEARRRAGAPIGYNARRVITLTQLAYAVAVQRHGTFSAAAKVCFVTQPTLSMQVQKLEEQLGVMIFDRSFSPVRATPLGARVLEQAAIVLAQAARIPAIVSETKESLEGELRLGVIPTLAPYLLPLFLDRFCRAHPKVHLHVEESKTDDIVAALRRDALDVGLLATPLGEPLIEEHPLFLEPFYVYLAKDHPLAARAQVSDADLAGERILLLTEGHCLRTQMLRACGPRRGQPRAARGFDFESGSLETLCRLVEQGLGYTVLPHLARGSNATRAGRVVSFTDPRPSREVSVCVHESFARRGLSAALAESIRDALPPELRARKGQLEKITLR